jgi:hypothetical protein
VRTIWKYELEWTDDPQPLMIPYKSMVLLGPHFAVQNDKLCIWAEVDTESEPTEYVFHVRGTGHPAPEDADYLGSTLHQEGRYVWHLFVSQDSP